MSSDNAATALLEEALSYRFRDAALLDEALTHPSASRERKGKLANNQRLEFLGDAVLGLVIAEYLYRKYPGEAEGELARRHAGLVCGESVLEVARQIGLGQHLVLSESEQSAGGRDSATHLEDACEALIGAIYLDGGLDAAAAVILRYWHPLAQKTTSPPKDAKSALQEWAQARGLPLPAYTTVLTEGPPHAPVFEIEVSLPGHAPVRARGSSKRAAEHAAAHTLLEQVQAHG